MLSKIRNKIRQRYLYLTDDIIQASSGWILLVVLVDKYSTRTCLRDGWSSLWPCAVQLSISSRARLQLLSSNVIVKALELCKENFLVHPILGITMIDEIQLCAWSPTKWAWPAWLPNDREQHLLFSAGVASNQKSNTHFVPFVSRWFAVFLRQGPPKRLTEKRPNSSAS